MFYFSLVTSIDFSDHQCYRRNKRYCWELVMGSLPAAHAAIKAIVHYSPIENHIGHYFCCIFTHPAKLHAEHHRSWCMSSSNISTSHTLIFSCHQLNGSILSSNYHEPNRSCSFASGCEGAIPDADH